MKFKLPNITDKLLNSNPSVIYIKRVIMKPIKFEIITFIVILVYIFIINNQFKLYYIFLALIVPLFILLIIAIGELNNYKLYCKNKYGKMHLDLDIETKDKNYQELLELYCKKKYCIDQLIARRTYLETFNIDFILDKTQSISLGCILTLIVTDCYREGRNLEQTEFIIIFLYICFLGIVIMPLINVYSKHSKIEASTDSTKLELNAVEYLININKENLVHHLYINNKID